MKNIKECVGTRDKVDIINEIKNTENYFKGQNVEVYIESEEKISQLKESMFHQGVVIAGDKESKLEFSVKMNSNPNFTIQILLAYAHTIPKLKTGVYSILDIPISLLGTSNNEKYI